MCQVVWSWSGHGDHNKSVEVISAGHTHNPQLQIWWFLTFTAGEIKDRVQYLTGLQYLFDSISPDQITIPQFIFDHDVKVYISTAHDCHVIYVYFTWLSPDNVKRYLYCTWLSRDNVKIHMTVIWCACVYMYMNQSNAQCQRKKVQTLDSCFRPLAYMYMYMYVGTDWTPALGTLIIHWEIF